VINVEKCALCGEEIDEENEGIEYIGEPDEDSFYITTNKKLVNEPLCEHEFEEPDGKIIAYKNSKPVAFVFKSGVVQNMQSVDDYGFTKNDLKEICDIANGYSWKRTDAWRGYSEGKKKVGTLVKAISTYTGRDNTDDLDELEDFLETKWNQKVYNVVTQSSNIFNAIIEVYVEEKDKNEFIKEIKKNISDTSEFDMM
jgi:hypothetical protein